MLRIMRIALGLVFLALFFLGIAMDTSAQNKVAGAKWEEYYSDRYDVQYYYDKGSFSFPKTNILQVLRQRVFPPGASYTKIITLDQIDCNKQKYRTLEIKVTNKDGSTQEFKKTAEWAYIYVGMPEDYFLREHCK
jgi:hypothetical protein